TLSNFPQAAEFDKVRDKVRDKVYDEVLQRRLRIPLKNHLLAAIIEDDAKLPENFHSDMPGQWRVHGRSFFEEVGCWLLNDRLPNLQFRQSRDLCSSAATHAVAAAGSAANTLLLQPVALHKIVSEAK